MENERSEHTEEWHPGKSFQNGPKELFLSQAMAIPCKRQGTNYQEDKERATEHIPTRQIAVVQSICEPTCKEIVRDR